MAEPMVYEEILSGQTLLLIALWLFVFHQVKLSKSIDFDSNGHHVSIIHHFTFIHLLYPLSNALRVTDMSYIMVIQSQISL